MTFSKLTEYFAKLEGTSSRNSMVEILAELFKLSQDDEIAKIVYLTQGRIAPQFENLEFGMAEKMVVKAMARAFDMEESKVLDAYKKSGDVGQTAHGLSQQSKSMENKQTVDDVFLKLKQIAQTSGEGSVEKKVVILAGLLASGGSESAKYLARIPVDKMRLGFSDQTVLEGLSWMLEGTKKLKGELEAAYNIRPDLGYIAEQVKKHGLKGIAHVEPKLGTPILVMRAERSTSPQEILEKTEGKAAVEPKLDGLRTQLHYQKVNSRNEKLDNKGNGEFDCIVRIFSRGQEEVTAMYPDLIAAAEKELVGVDSVILDGEAIGFDPKTGKYLQFQETVQRKRKYDVEEFSKSVPLRLVTFDCLYLNGKSLINEPYLERRREVERLLGGEPFDSAQGKAERINDNKILVAARMEIVDDPIKLEKIFEEDVKNGFEGIMAKKLDGVYQAGARGWNWIKFKKSYNSKLADTVDAVVMGYDFGQGNRNKFGIGSFLVGVYDHKTDSFKTLSKIGTGLTDEEWRTLAVRAKGLTVGAKPLRYDTNKLMDCDVWVTPELVGEFKADELTKSPMHTAGFALRFPRLEKWREKKAEDTTSLEEIVALAKR